MHSTYFPFNILKKFKTFILSTRCFFIHKSLKKGVDKLVVNFMLNYFFDVLEQVPDSAFPAVVLDQCVDGLLFD